MDSEFRHCSHHLISIIIVFVKKPFPLGPVETVTEVSENSVTNFSAYQIPPTSSDAHAHSREGLVSALQYTPKRSHVLPPSACRTQYVVHEQLTTFYLNNTEAFNGDSQQKHGAER